MEITRQRIGVRQIKRMTKFDPLGFTFARGTVISVKAQEWLLAKSIPWNIEWRKVEGIDNTKFNLTFGYMKPEKQIKKECNMPKGKNRGACGAKPRMDGSGKGKGNKGTKRQPKK